MENIQKKEHIQSFRLHADSHLKCKIHTEYMIPKLSGSYYPLRQMFHISNLDILPTIYFAYFHFIMKYGVILGVIHLTVKGCLFYPPTSP
jgi:hypothetical protein